MQSSAAEAPAPYTEDCSICLETVQERGLMRECSTHHFCHKCIMWWLTRTTPRCPLCRTLVTRVAKCDSPNDELYVDWKKEPIVQLTSSILSTLNEQERFFYECLVEDEADSSFEGVAADDDAAEHEIGSDAESESEDALLDDKDDESFLDEYIAEEGRETPASFWDDEEGPVFSDHDGTVDDEYGGAIAFSERRGERHLPNWVPPTRVQRRRRRRHAEYTPSESSEEEESSESSSESRRKRRTRRRRVLVQAASPVRRAVYRSESEDDEQPRAKRGRVSRPVQRLTY